MKNDQVTVSDVTALISAREDVRAEIHLLTLEAYEHWRALEAKLHALEARFDRSADAASEVRIRVPAAAPPLECLPVEPPFERE